MAACGAPTGREVRSDAPAAEPDRDTLEGGVAAANAFALDLTRAVGTRGGNVATASYTIARSLAMARAGARNNTRAALDRVLHVELADNFDLSFTAIDESMAARSGEQRNATRKGTIELALPSALWAQEETRFTPEFLDSLARDFETGARVVDFRSEPDEARDAINRWAAAATHATVDLLVPRGEVSDFTRFVVASAGSIHAPWATRFAPEETTRANFTLLDGRKVDVASMTARNEGTIRSARAQDWQAVELPYLGGELAMLIVVPNPGEFDAFAETFSPDRLSEITRGLSPTPIELRLPRFQFTSVLTLDDELTTLGMADAFSSDAADFSGITGDEVLAISDVVHGTYVAADEEGTDGDAVTVVPATDPIAPGLPIVDVDRPFFFLVRDTVTDLILQLGRVVEPQT